MSTPEDINMTFINLSNYVDWVDVVIIINPLVMNLVNNYINFEQFNP